MEKHGIQPIDLVCINLYPFEQTVRKPGVTFEEAIENIDIGGPSMIRSAAKNHRWVLVVTAPERYEKVLGDLREHNGATCGKHRLKQAQRAFAHTAEYDSIISNYLATAGGIDSAGMVLNLHKALDLRYGENPHQKATLLVGKKPDEASVAFARQLHGKALSYINLLDADGALACVKEFDKPAAVIVKHTTPCGAAIAEDLPTAFRRAFEGDPLAAFGGIVALNRSIDLATAQAITSIDKLLEVIVAPDFQLDALKLLRERWKNVRLLEVGPVGRFDSSELHMHKIVGGMLVQQRDLLGIDEADWKVVSNRNPTAKEMADLKFAWLVCKHVKSNAIVVAKDGMLMAPPPLARWTARRPRGWRLPKRPSGSRDASPPPMRFSLSLMRRSFCLRPVSRQSFTPAVRFATRRRSIPSTKRTRPWFLPASDISNTEYFIPFAPAASGLLTEEQCGFCGRCVRGAPLEVNWSEL